MLNKIFVLLLLIQNVHAAGSGDAKVTDLAWPFFNFFVLFGFMVWKFKKPINDGYTKMSLEVEEKFNSAKNADIKAKEFLNEQIKFRDNSDSELANLQVESDKNWDKQKKIIEAEFNQKIKKLYSDFDSKLKNERKKIESDISSNLLEKIIEKTTSSISSSPEKKSSAMRKFLQ